MSLLWSRVGEAARKEAMAWYTEPGEEHYAQTAKSVRHAGYAGYVGSGSEDDDYEDEGEDHDEFDEDLYDQAHENIVQSRDERYFEEHDDHSQSYHNRKDNEYERLLKEKGRENEPDHEDPELHDFVRNHGTNTHHWQTHGTYGAVSLRQPVFATQSHVSQTHIDKYLSNPGAVSHHKTKYGETAGNSQYLGDGAPMFVTHGGRLHATEGHHRVAAALQHGDGNMPGHPDYEEHWSKQ